MKEVDVYTKDDTSYKILIKILITLTILHLTKLYQLQNAPQKISSINLINSWIFPPINIFFQTFQKIDNNMTYFGHIYTH